MEETTNTVNDDLLNQLIDSTNKNTEAIEHLEEYLILKDKEREKKEAEEKKASEEKEKLDQEDQEAKDQETAKAAEESAAKADAQTETYTELLTEINEGVQLTNQLLTVEGIYIGIVIGLLFIKIFVDRLTKK